MIPVKEQIKTENENVGRNLAVSPHVMIIT